MKGIAALYLCVILYDSLVAEQVGGQFYLRIVTVFLCVFLRETDKTFLFSTPVSMTHPGFFYLKYFDVNVHANFFFFFLGFCSIILCYIDYFKPIVHTCGSVCANQWATASTHHYFYIGS